MTNLFENIFYRNLVKEANGDIEQTPGSTPEVTDAEAMQANLDPGTDPTDLDVQQHTLVATQASAAAAAKMVSEVQGWVTKLDDMIKFLNSTDPKSIQSQLAAASPKSLFDSIRVGESKKISRVSMDIASLSEMLKGYLAGAADPKYRGV